MAHSAGKFVLDFTPGTHPKKNWAGSLTMKLEPMTTGICFADRYMVHGGTAVDPRSEFPKNA